MEKLNFSIASKSEAVDIIENEITITPAVIIFLAGDRISCCDEAVIMRTEQGELVGIATISPTGEEYNEKPEIVGMYILPQFRGQGLAKSLLEKTITRCRERGFEKIYMFVLNKKIISVIKTIPEEMINILEVSDQSGIFELPEKY